MEPSFSEHSRTSRDQTRLKLTPYSQEESQLLLSQTPDPLCTQQEVMDHGWSGELEPTQTLNRQSCLMNMLEETLSTWNRSKEFLMIAFRSSRRSLRKNSKRTKKSLRRPSDRLFSLNSTKSRIVCTNSLRKTREPLRLNNSKETSLLLTLQEETKLLMRERKNALRSETRPKRQCLDSSSSEIV